MPGMRKRLQQILMATPVVAISFSPMLLGAPLWAATGADGAAQPIAAATHIAATKDDSGRTIYTNDYMVAPAASSETTASIGTSRNALMFWSVTEHRWKPVPSAKMGAARSAAAEVSRYLRRSNSANVDAVLANSNYFRNNTKQFSDKDVDAAIEQAAARHNVDPNLVRSVIKVESNFNPNAVSRKGAMGLMQLMPQTARSLNVSNPFDPEQNVDAGVRHLKKLLESYGGDVRLTLAAYNAGSGAVARSAGVPRFSETQNYVKRITNLYYGGSEPGSHIIGNPVHDPVHVQRDARGQLYISNTE
jgi:soluble lytic murein transglycosylase-like protein